MNDFLLIASVSLGVMLVMGALLGLAIGIVAKKFFVPVDERIEEVQNMLPGANCGGCGFAGCADFAKGLVIGTVTAPEKCTAASEAAVEAIAAYLGLISDPGIKKVAVVFCGGSQLTATQGAHYNGVADCKSAMLVSAGVKVCSAGCLGYASCANACPFNAIEIRDGLAVVHPDVCVGCGKCVETCPRQLIRLVPKSAPVHIYCNAKVKGAEKRKFCKTACIGCRKCVKVVKEGQITIEGSLAVINYSDPPPPETVELAACPMHCIGLAQDYQMIGEIIKEKTHEA